MQDQNKHIKLSVVIVNYNVRYFLEQCLLSVQKALQNIPSEIIVVDNNSTDDSCTMLKTKFKDIILIENKLNVGFSKANNQGVQKAKGEFILILNPDTVLSEDTLLKTIDFASKTDNIGALGVQFIDGKGHFLKECKRGIPTPKIAFGKLFGFPKKAIDTYYASHIKENAIAKIEILTGAFMLLKKQIYREVNGFDEDYFMYGEDIDLSYKILKNGYQNYYFGKQTIIHYKGESTIKDKKYLNRFYGAMQIFYKKHFKTNLFLKHAIFAAVKFWYFVKMISLQKSKKKISNKVNRIIYIGKNEQTFAKIKKTINPELAVFHQDISIKDILANKPDKLIFDMNDLMYKNVFSVMKALKNTKINFRFIPGKSDFFIGSDSNNSKGEVVLLS